MGKRSLELIVEPYIADGGPLVYLEVVMGRGIKKVAHKMGRSQGTNFSGIPQYGENWLGVGRPFRVQGRPVLHPCVHRDEPWHDFLDGILCIHEKTPANLE